MKILNNNLKPYLKQLMNDGGIKQSYQVTVFTRVIVVTIIFTWHAILSRLFEVDDYSRRTIKF